MAAISGIGSAIGPSLTRLLNLRKLARLMQVWRIEIGYDNASVCFHKALRNRVVDTAHRAGVLSRMIRASAGKQKRTGRSMRRH
jgi:hypothetical protein